MCVPLRYGVNHGGVAFTPLHGNVNWGPFTGLPDVILSTHSGAFRGPLLHLYLRLAGG